MCSPPNKSPSPLTRWLKEVEHLLKDAVGRKVLGRKGKVQSGLGRNKNGKLRGINSSVHCKLMADWNVCLITVVYPIISLSPISTSCLGGLFWLVPLDASELSSGLAREERVRLQTSRFKCRSHPARESRGCGLTYHTRSAKHLKVTTRVIYFFMCKCTHLYVDLHVRTLSMCVALCGFCVHEPTHWEQLLNFATGRDWG